MWNYITGQNIFVGVMEPDTINYISSYDPEANLIFKTWTRPSLMYINLTNSSAVVTRLFEAEGSNAVETPLNHEFDFAFNRIDQCLGGGTGSFLSF